MKGLWLHPYKEDCEPMIFKLQNGLKSELSTEFRNSFGEPEEAISREIGDDIVIRINAKNEIVGVTVLNFEKSNARGYTSVCKI